MLAVMLAARVVFEPPAEVVIASERPEVIEQPVSLTVLGAAAGERVALYAAGEERPRVGRLVAFDGESVVLSQRDGMLVLRGRRLLRAPFHVADPAVRVQPVAAKRKARERGRGEALRAGPSRA